ncbi:helix-turn-helix domain-containing protein [Terrimonas sp. NA20]|uniref:Helix-turn-helix domain-containing protein n=1 Tax=Terrimonas ginsenosidimutans TaxID=2908004 RepID=A0ABS9KMN1_9BACT|nr:helix-turn-helix domain-containing protein [Terrimonas ginsenosidimutans]MCG2613570.1 helix-turn-helix domain-containing protein [Terrimonas ginsenosidimutans]
MHVISTIAEFHKILSLPAPLHPLVSVIHVEDMRPVHSDIWAQFVSNFYHVSLKKDVQARIKYGQQYYDFDKGTMTFIAPKQVQSITADEAREFEEKCGKGYVLMFHPDFLGNHNLATDIKNYGFFSYAVHEALHLSEREEKNMVDIFEKIESEYQHIDRHTQDIILSQIDLLMSYSIRFYERQFITRKVVNNDLVTRMEQLLSDYFDKEEPLTKGLPNVEHFAKKLNLSGHYLSDMLRTLTGQSAQHHIHEKVINKAKEYLSSSKLTVAEIAYQLGFEYPQSFNKLFRKKMDMSPLEFRQSFN